MRAFGTQPRVLLDVHRRRDPTVGNPPNEDGRVRAAFGAPAMWASRADALHMISERTPDVANDVVRKFGDEEPQHGWLGELRVAANEPDRKGFWWRPSWTELHEECRPPRSETREPGEWPRDWQYWASSVLDSHFRKNSMLTNRPPLVKPTCALTPVAMLELRSPTLRPQQSVQFLLTSFVLLLERLQLPLPVTEATCNGCHEPLDTLGRHRAACTRSGRVKKRAGPTERVLARVCREAGPIEI